MSLNHSPKIATNELVFAYDMSNTQKSWKGAPTSNLIYTTPLTIGKYAYCTGPVVTSVLGHTGDLVNANRYTITTNSAVARAAVGINVTVGATYSFSALIRYNGNSPAPSFYVNATKGNPEASGSNTIINETSSFTKISGNWYLIKWTFTVSASPTGKALVLWGVTSSASDIGNTFDVYNEHLEQLSYVTPFVNGTRSNTQAILDLTGNNTITATALTYATDGTFSFGSGNSMSVASSSNWAFGQNGSIEAWIYPTSNTGTNNRLWCVSNNSSSLDAYFNGSTNNVYMHGGIIGTTTALSLNAWTHVAVAYMGGTVSIYFNGVSQSLTGTTTGYNITNSGALLIGNYSAGTGYNFNGKISSVKVYKRALIAAEVKQNFNALRGRYGV